jgi:hypothetical protein
MSEQEVEVLITMISSLIRPKFGKYFISSQVTYFNRGIFNYLNKNVNSTKLTSLVSLFSKPSGQLYLSISNTNITFN